MNLFNRIAAIVLWLVLLAVILQFAVVPQFTVGWLQVQLALLARWLAANQAANPTSFLVGQAALGIGALLLFGTLLFFEFMIGRKRGVRIRTPEGGSAELDTSSVGRRLQWHLDQLAEVITVIPAVKSRGSAVDIRLEIEREFREHRIEIAFPQLDVNIKELPPRTKAPLPSAEPRASKRRAPRRPRRVLPAGAKGVKPGDKKTANPDDGDDDENNS